MRTIKGRITFWAELILILTIAIVTVANVYYLGDRLANKQKDVLQANTNYYAEEINSSFKLLQGILAGFEGDIEAHGLDDAAYISQIAKEIKKNDNEISDIYFATEDGRFMHVGNVGTVASTYDPRTRDWYVKTKEAGKMITLNPYEDATTGMMVASIVTPVVIDGEFVGCAGIDVSIQVIKQAVSQINYAEGSYGYLVDSDGNIVSHPDESKMPTSDSKCNVLEDLPEVAKVATEKQDVIEVINYLDTECYLAFSYLDGPGWCLITVIPTEHIKAVLYTARMLAVAVGVIVALITAILGYFLLKKELTAITPMVETAKKISKGQFEFEPNYKRGNDEIGRIQQAMYSMVHNMQDIIDEQKLVLDEMSRGNLAVQDMREFPGEYNEISKSINSIKEKLNDLISDIQMAAINLQSTAIGLTGCVDEEEMKAVFKELSREATELMEKAGKFKTDLR